jgi:hypothetical protein
MRDRWRLIAIVFLLTSGPWALAGDEAELSGYFEGLRAQGLFRVAEEYALDRLADPEIPATTRAILAVELSKVFATHAAEARSEGEALELWTRAGEVIAPLLAQRDNPRWFTVRSRQATIQCELALTEFWMSQLDPDSVARRDAALQSAFTALTELQTAASDLKGGTPPGLRGTKAAEGTLTTAELRHLGDEIEYLTIRMQLNRARLSPTGADRAAALLNAEQGSTALARRVNSDFVWPARLARIEAMRLQGDPEKAFTFAKSLLTPDLSPTLTDALVAEQARAKLALNTPADAIALVLEQGRMSGTLAPELRAIAIECLLVSLQAAQDKGDAALVDDLFQQATTQQQLITGPWRVYIDSLLARTHESRQYGEKLAALVREGRVAAQRRDWPAAAEAYARASQVAATDGKAPLAAEFAFMQASIEIEAGNFEQAAQLLGQYQIRYPGDIRAAEAHLLAAWTLGQLDQQCPSEARRAAYLAQLQEHLSKFPESPTRMEAQWSLAIDAIQHREWLGAIDGLEAIPPDHARAQAAATQLPYCYEQGLATLSESPERPLWEQRAESYFFQQIARWPKPPAGWTLSQSENALRWARVLLRLQDRRYADADSLLVQIMHSRDVESREVARDGSRLDPAWDRLVPAATQLRIITLAGLGRLVEAEKLLASATSAAPQDVLAILSGLSQLATSLDEASRRNLGRVQLTAARQLDRQRSTLTPEVALQVDRCLAEAYTATGDLPEAIALYEALRKTDPKDRSLLEAIGTLSVKRGQPADLKRAKSIYRQLESFDPAGSPAWLRTRLTIARVCLQLGEKAECQKLLKVTRILYPELGGAELRGEYAELEEKLTGSK